MPEREILLDKRKVKGFYSVAKNGLGFSTRKEPNGHRVRRVVGKNSPGYNSGMRNMQTIKRLGYGSELSESSLLSQEEMTALLVDFTWNKPDDVLLRLIVDEPETVKRSQSALGGRLVLSREASPMGRPSVPQPSSDSPAKKRIDKGHSDAPRRAESGWTASADAGGSSEATAAVEEAPPALAPLMAADAGQRPAVFPPPGRTFPESVAEDGDFVTEEPEGVQLVEAGLARDPLSPDAAAACREGYLVEGMDLDHHETLTHTGVSVDLFCLSEAVDRLSAKIIGRPDLELLPVSPLALMGDSPVPVLPPLTGPPKTTIAVVYIGRGSGHFVTLVTHPETAPIVHVLDSLQSYTRSERHPDYVEHLVRVGAAMMRWEGTEGVQLRFHKVLEQGPFNSCGAYSFLFAAAVVFGMRVCRLRTTGTEASEMRLRLLIHNFAFSNATTGVFDLSPVIQLLEEASDEILPRDEDPGVQHLCHYCHWLNNHWDLHSERGPDRYRSPPELTEISRSAVKDTPPLRVPLTEAAGPLLPRPARTRGRAPRPADPANPDGKAVSETVRAAPPPKELDAEEKARIEATAVYEIPLLKRKGVLPAEESLCPDCTAWLFREEFLNVGTNKRKEWCCGQGRRLIPRLIPYEAPFYREGQWINAEFQRNTRFFNNSYSFAATGVTGKFINLSSGIQWLRLQGKTYHFVWDQSYRTDTGARTSQLVILDPSFRAEQADKFKVSRALQEQVHQFLESSSTLMGQYKRLSQMPQEDAFMKFLKTERRTYGPVLGDTPGQQHNLMPSVDEVIGVLGTTGEEAALERDVVIHKAGDARTQTLFNTNPIFDAVSFPVFRPAAEPSWSPDMKGPPVEDEDGQVKRATITMLLYYRSLFLTQPRTWELGRLAEEVCIDAYSRIEESRLRFVRYQLQDKLRRASRDELADYLGEAQSGARPGTAVILPASFTDSPRNRKSNYLDSMGTVTRKGSPHFLITMTANPAWKEVNLRSMGIDGPQVPKKGPGITARVFKLKQDQLMRELRSGEILGSPQAWTIGVDEWQNRGLPHTHVATRLKKELKVTDIDALVWARLPPKDMPRLRQKVLKHMIHGPCNQPHLYKSPCLDSEGRCTKGFPKDFAEATTQDQNGFTLYARPRGDEDVVVKVVNGKKVQLKVDNRFVVPFNPELLLLFDCHINIEVASHARFMKYMFKYLYKGPARALAVAAVEGTAVDEVKDYEDRRTVTTNQCHWRIYEFSLHYRTIAVKALNVHLDGKDLLHFDPDNPQLWKADEKTTELMRYFSRPRGAQFDDLKLLDYYEQFLEHNTEVAKSTPHPDGIHFIRARQDKSEKICRLHFVPNGLTELYYLRLLLVNRPSRSWKGTRTVDGVVHETFQAAAKALGLATDDTEYLDAIDEAAQFTLGPGLRHLFLAMMVGQQDAPSRFIWDHRKDVLSDDLIRRFPLSLQTAHNEALLELSRLLAKHGRTLSDQGLPDSFDPSTELSREEARWEPEQLDNYIRMWEPLMNRGQKAVVDLILAHFPGLERGWARDAMEEAALARQMEKLSQIRTRPQLYFLEAPGGCGKTAVVRLLAKILRRAGKVVLTVATTGIAAQNYEGGTTGHSMFKLPFDAFNRELNCNVTGRSQRADLIRAASLIFYDESAMMHRNTFRAFLRLIEDLQPPHLEAIVFLGDFRQIPPVIKYGTKNDNLRASIRFDAKFRTMTRPQLTENVRAKSDPENAAMVEAVAKDQGEKREFTGHAQPLTRLKHVATEKTLQDLMRWVFPHPEDPYECSGRALLAGTNEQIDAINETMLEQVEGEVHTLLSCDRVGVDETGYVHQIPQETLATFSDVGVPPHRLNLKVGAIAMIMRNLDFGAGLVNSRKVIVRGIQRHIVLVEVPEEDGSAGRQWAVHRMDFHFQPGGKGMNVVRRQFPIRVAFCLTFNKSQGQTLDRVGLDLRSNVFAHGQLYVALSRVRQREDIRVLTEEERIYGGAAYALNIVFEELIEEVAGALEEPERPASPTASLCADVDDDDYPDSDEF